MRGNLIPADIISPATKNPPVSGKLPHKTVIPSEKGIRDDLGMPAFFTDMKG
jgi:hypothetical protein